MNPSIRRLLPRLALLVVGTGLGVGLLVLLLRSVNLDQLGSDIASANFGFLALSFLPFLVNLLIKVPRAALLYGDDAPGWDTLFGAINVGYGINALMPARLGEVARAYWVRDRAGISMVRSLSTIAVERVVDGVAVLIIFLVMLPTVAFPGKLLGSALTIGALFIVVLAAMVVVAVSSTRENNRIGHILRRLESGRWAPIARAIEHAITGLQVLRNRRAIALLIGYTAIVWISNALFAWLVLRSFHINAPLTAGFLLISGLNLGMAVPSTPGYVGVFEGGVVLILGLYGVHRTVALAAALVLHAIGFGPSTLIAVIYLARFGLQSTVQMLRSQS